MQLKNGTFCPLLKKDCVGLQCAWFARVQGRDMNTGNQVDDYQCAIAWMPMLLIENSGQQRQTGAAGRKITGIKNTFFTNRTIVNNY